MSEKAGYAFLDENSTARAGNVPDIHPSRTIVRLLHSLGGWVAECGRLARVMKRVLNINIKLY